MYRLFSLLILFVAVMSCNMENRGVKIQTTMDIDAYKNNQSLDYENLINHYKILSLQYHNCKIIEYGKSDVGKPIYVFVIDNSRQFTANKDKAVLLINNGIHPGEPCGVDASVNFAKAILEDKSLTENVVIGIIPLYNVGGSLNRGCCSRANQNGPEMYGFRGNARNLDLNRDFIKRFSKNAQVFSQIFHDLEPNLFVDTHASNGADYQHVMTLITTQLNKLNPTLADYTREALEPYLYQEMGQKGYPMVPYVSTKGTHPESGIVDYLETPRYSTGYATLFNTIGFVTETHMWKPYEERVKSTEAFLHSIAAFANKNFNSLLELKKTADQEVSQQKNFALNWELDTTHYKEIDFQGYKAVYTISELTGQERYFYDRNQPFNKKIKHYNTYNVSEEVEKPKFYVIPQAWKEIVERLKDNRIAYTLLEKDTIINVQTYYIDEYQTLNMPYEGAYLHYNTRIRKEQQNINFYKGDIMVPCNQTANRFIMETLEPTAPDSYFSWGFFDEILQQKEYFSSYIFEEKAKEILANNPELKADFEEKKASDQEFNLSHRAQLDFIYKHSKHYEKSHKRYPVYRIN